MAQPRQDIEKRVSASLKRIKIKCFPRKNGILNVRFYPFPNLEFWQNFQKSCFIISIDVWPLPLMVYSDLLIFEDGTLNKILLCIRLILGKYYTYIM